MIQEKFRFDEGVRRERYLAGREVMEARVKEFGVNTLADGELLEFMLECVIRRAEAGLLGAKLLEEAGSIHALLAWHQEDFRRAGLPPRAARLLVGIGEAARRLARGPVGEAATIRRGEDVASHLRPKLMGLEVEKFWVFCLNRKQRLIRLVEISSGTQHSTLASAAVVFRAAIRHGASAIICAHNHPSGDPAPSQADNLVTRNLRDAARTVEIDLLDHVIVGEPARDPARKGYYSFREAGLV